MSASRNELVSVFTKEAIVMIKYAGNLFKSIPVDRIMNGIRVGKRVDHEIVVTTIGPFLYKYRDVIADVNCQMNADEINARIQRDVENSHADEHKEMIAEIFVSLFVDREKIKSEDREFIYSKLAELLKLYLDFSIRCRYEPKS